MRDAPIIGGMGRTPRYVLTLLWMVAPWMGGLWMAAGIPVAWAQSAPGPGATLYVPRTGAPAGAPVAVTLSPPAAPAQTLSATVAPGAAGDPACPLPLTAAINGAGPAGETMVTIGAAALACGGGGHRVRLHLAAPAAGGAAAIGQDVTMQLSIRFEPNIDVRTAAQPVELQSVQCWMCWTGMTPWLTTTLFPQLRRSAQTVEVQNNSIGPVTIKAALSAQGASPDVVAGGVAVSPAEATLGPNAITQFRLQAKGAGQIGAGAQELRLSLSAAEANVASPVLRVSAVPVRLNVRYGVVWALVALLLGYLLGRAIALLQDPAYAAKIAFIDHLRMVRFHAVKVGAPAATLAALDRLASDLDFVAAVTDDMTARLKTIEDGLDGSVGAQAVAARGAARPPRMGSRALGWILAGQTPAAAIGADVVRPLVQIGIIVVGLLSGLKINYLDAPTFGATGVYDLLPLIIWGATTMAVAKSLDSFGRR